MANLTATAAELKTCSVVSVPIIDSYGVILEIQAFFGDCLVRFKADPRPGLGSIVVGSRDGIIVYAILVHSDIGEDTKSGYSVEIWQNAIPNPLCLPANVLSAYFEIGDPKLEDNNLLSAATELLAAWQENKPISEYLDRLADAVSQR